MNTHDVFKQRAMNIKKNILKLPLDGLWTDFDVIGRIIHRLERHVQGKTAVADLTKLANAFGGICDPSGDNFEYIVKRVEWVFQVVETDQYGTTRGVISESAYATQEEAKQAMETDSDPHPHVSGRRFCAWVGHPYHDAIIIRREVTVEQAT